MTNLSVCQENALKDFMEFMVDPDKKEFVLMGHSGTGKTFIAAEMLKAIRAKEQILKHLKNEKGELNFALTATTNKAARVLERAIVNNSNVNLAFSGKTIHSLLGLRLKNNFKTGKQELIYDKNAGKINNALIIIDEASMADDNIIKAVHRGTEDCKILWIGDPYQLAPIMCKNSPVFTKFGTELSVLETIQRQNTDSIIPLIGDQFRKTIKTGVFKDIPVDNKSVFHIESGNDWKNLISDNFSNQEDIDDNRIVAWTNSRINFYNGFVRSLFFTENHPVIGEQFVANSAVLGASGMPIINNEQMVTINNVGPRTIHEYTQVEGFEVTTREGTFFMAADYDQKNALLKAYGKAKDWPRYFCVKDTIADLRPPYAQTIHKAQGSTYKNVFIDLNDIGKNNKAEEVARLLYVAITRASEKVYLKGELPKKYRG